ncbi:MAG TPA: 2-C-methyl-D-erythritol 2,4-cyclodiphosphate synthase [Caldisericia bacterium]|nr:2-C-methyl-D-erythritol 2,4-cyclodiphosphate synthase [Caldisericia bacterium]HPB34132.1 2-C-methyl-D-erythritol 2,4-cyclodiphosphate synthase [Caldisericia bacterium]HQL66875.1 2-C-methyl-D-erythritol 2,4-cyclodiphosphate synthase [Caldisericia bacterium]
MKIGIGFDFHIIKKNLPLFLGGVELKKEYGLFSDTDGDILIHSLIDAILGAIGEKDIGETFNENWKGKKSSELLINTMVILNRKNFKIINIDSIIIIETIKISIYKEKIIENLSNLIGIEKEKINIKGKTMEKMGYIGHKKGGAALTVVLIE